MLRRSIALLLACILFPFTHAAIAQALQFSDVPSTLRPGKTERISFEAQPDQDVSIRLLDRAGKEIVTIFPNYPAAKGTNHFLWNGYTADGKVISEGEYQLLLVQGEQKAYTPLSVGQIGPVIISFGISGASILPGTPWQIDAVVNMPGYLSLSAQIDGQWQVVASVEADQSEKTLAWDGLIDGLPAPEGTLLLSIDFVDLSGFSANTQFVSVNVLAPKEMADEPQEESKASVPPIEETATQAAAEQFTTPAPTDVPEKKPQIIQYKPPTADEVPEEELGSNYWTLPVGKWDEEAIWRIMMQPITVIDGKDQRLTYKLRKEPDASTKNGNIIGEITFLSQGVHVLETRDDGWSLIEVFNSSYGPDCASRRGWGNSDDLLRGYVETKYLKQITPRSDYGLLIDKLEQVMYIFKEGKKIGSVLISTGLPTQKQPWNETPSGEFLMVSRTGRFNAGNLVCAMGMRINGGCLMHEVPYILNEATNYKDYSSEEWKLGSKASHGCVRIQRKKNPDGFNMDWLWNNIKVNTKVLVWDDQPGRYTPYPEDDLMLYFNPKGGRFYHLDPNCSSIKDRYLPLKGSFPYSRLEDPEHSKFTPCKHCRPPLSKTQIDELNSQQGFH